MAGVIRGALLLVCLAAGWILATVYSHPAAEAARRMGLEVQAVYAADNAVRPSEVEGNGSGKVTTAGRVVADESRVFELRAASDGRILEVSAAPGIVVRRGDKLGAFRSPALIGAEKAFLAALEAEHSGRPVNPRVLRFPGSRYVLQLGAAPENVARATDALRVLGMADEEIDILRTTRELREDCGIYSPIDGVVVSRAISAGDTTRRGAEWFRIADLSRVWVLTSLPERDASLLQTATTVTLRCMGEAAPVRIEMIAPAYDSGTRTLKVRLAVENPRNSLRPGLLVDVEFGVAATSRG